MSLERVACICFCALHACITCRGQKRELDTLELELQRVVSHQNGARHHSQVLWKKYHCSSLLSHLLSSSS